MPRKKPAPPKPERRTRGTGSISVNPRTGIIRARLPKTVDPDRTAREFRPGQMTEAIAWLDAAICPQPASAPAATMTLGTWAGIWWQDHVEGVRPPNTARTYLYYLSFLESQYAVLLPDLRTTALQRIVGGLVGRVAASTIEAAVGAWRRCLDAAIEDDHLTKNPANRITLPTVPKKSQAAVRYVTSEDVARLWPAIRGQRFEAAFALILGCGLRISEILGLPWDHVDFLNRRIWVQWQFTNGHWRYSPKGYNPHWVPMPEDVAQPLLALRDDQPDGYSLVMQSPWRGKYARREGSPRPWSRGVVARDLAALITSVGLDAFTPHAGRHGLATVLMNAGVPPAVIAERLGNTPAMVLNVYGHATPGGHARADEAVARYLNGTPPETVSGPESDDRGGVGATG